MKKKKKFDKSNYIPNQVLTQRSYWSAALDVESAGVEENKKNQKKLTKTIVSKW